VTQPTLLGEHYSPWTLRARWALDHHGLGYRYREHAPMLGELLLRLRTRPPPGALATVPAWVDGAVVIRNSVDIMLYADRVGGGPRLVRDESSLREIAALAEPGLSALRALVLARTLRDRDALRENAAVALPTPLTHLAAPLSALGARYLARKHRAHLDDPDAHLSTLRATLSALTERIDTQRTPTQATLTAEHIILATLLQGVLPVSDAHVPLGPATRRTWTTGALLAECAPLLTWRDELCRAAHPVR
jgi:glutathione S-transferase